MNEKRILLVGQTPPPYGGQAMMIERTLRGNYGLNISIFHVRMSFSKNMDNVGKFELKKIFHLLKIIFLIYFNRIKNKTNVLYYFPAGPRIVPIIRDILILGSTKFLFKKTIFHFRAAGISEYLRKKNLLIQKFLKLIYGKPDATIRLSPYTPEDDKYFGSHKRFIIPNGIEDNFNSFQFNEIKKDDVVCILYIGVLNNSKGIIELLNAFCNINRDNVHLNLVGKFEDKKIEREIKTIIIRNNLQSKVKLHGVLIGEAKFKQLMQNDIFAFPTYFESEGLPGAILEAMSFAKPIVATNWRGVPSLVHDGKNGFLVPIKNIEQLKEKIMVLSNNVTLRNEYGTMSRRIYLEKFTLDKYYENMNYVFESL